MKQLCAGLAVIISLMIVTIRASYAAEVISPQSIRVEADIIGGAKTGDNNLQLKVFGPQGKPHSAVTIRLTVEMAAMDMGSAHPEVKNVGNGTYEATIHLSMSGTWRVTAVVETSDKVTLTKIFEFKAGASEHHHDEAMMGRLGPWSMTREGSGTSWLPDSSPMFMKMIPVTGRYELNSMGFITMNESDSGGDRGRKRFYSNSMLMLMARRQTGKGVLGLSLMGSLDPIFNGEYGYPDLFQTGETAYGNKLTDFQHPHDLLTEVTASYSIPVGHDLHGFIYGGPVGEPALGGPTFMHRPSGMEIPEAPISHHWFDSTHIAWGVLTLGLNSPKWQVEASAFNGHEPDENRYSPDNVRLDSASTRITFNPTHNWSFNASYGFLRSPESSEPGVDQHRVTAAALWSQPMGEGKNLSVTAAFGRNIVQGHNSDSFLAEGTYSTPKTSLFARWEHVMKDELIGVPAGNYMINKFLVGGVRNIWQRDGVELGVGAYAGFYIFPSELNAFYGRNPMTVGVFLRLRPSRMAH